MKYSISTILLGIIFLLLPSCGEDDMPKPQSNSINKIMPLGASRVQGNRPEYESFRYELWKDLIENDWIFDFIGTQSDEANYPLFNDTDFDIDHEGRGGWTSGEILEELNGWLDEAGTPDIVLFSSPAGNDALQNLSYTQAISNINEIIDILQTNNPNIIIIIEQLAPAHSDSMTNELADFLTNLHQDVLTIASEQTTASSQIIPVDMFTGFTDAMFADEVHYNEMGATFIADRYYDVLINVLE